MPWLGIEPLEHHKRVDVPESRVEEGAGKRAHHLEATPLPQTHGGIVRGDHEVELHRLEPVLQGLRLRVIAHL